MIEVTPSAAKTPATSASHTHQNSMAMPTTMKTKRMRSLKIVGNRSRHEPFSPRWKTRWLMALITTTMISSPKTVATTLGHVLCSRHAPGCVMSTRIAATGTR